LDYPESGAVTALSYGKYRQQKNEVIMTPYSVSLMTVYEGWNSYHQSIVNAIKPLSREQIMWRPADNFNSVGELARHISLGRITWFSRMEAPGSVELTRQIPEWEVDSDGNRDIIEKSLGIAENPGELVCWLDSTWQMIENTLNLWNIADLKINYHHKWNGQIYTPSRQWTIWRVMNHDIHHGGELSLMLGLQGIEAFELSVLFGHTILPPLLEE
jgi:uncharacterized damage-inducible protein DinB